MHLPLASEITVSSRSFGSYRRNDYECQFTPTATVLYAASPPVSSRPIYCHAPVLLVTRALGICPECPVWTPKIHYLQLFRAVKDEACCKIS